LIFVHVFVCVAVVQSRHQRPCFRASASHATVLANRENRPLCGSCGHPGAQQPCRIRRRSSRRAASCTGGHAALLHRSAPLPRLPCALWHRADVLLAVDSGASPPSPTRARSSAATPALCETASPLPDSPSFSPCDTPPPS